MKAQVSLLVKISIKQKIMLQLFIKLKTFEALKSLVHNTSLKNYQVLIKASRGMALERILDFLKFPIKFHKY